MKYSITKNGVPLNKSLYTMDEETKTFSTNESGLVLDFRNEDNCTFKTGSSCTFNTGFECVVVRRDIYEVIELKEGVKIKLKGLCIKGFTEIEPEEVSLSGKEVSVTLDGKTYIAVIK